MRSDPAYVGIPLQFGEWAQLSAWLAKAPPRARGAVAQATVRLILPVSEARYLLRECAANPDLFRLAEAFEVGLGVKAGGF